MISLRDTITLLPMLPYPFLIPLFIRSLRLLLPQTYFQPDEFFQSLEPAHNLVFGYGHLTWEWKDLPSGNASGWIDGGRMRGWLWPLVFAAVYRVLALLKLDETFLLTFAPRLVGVSVAALTDYQMSRLSSKILGSGSGAAALFLSLTSLFNAHLLPRALSTSPETLLTVAALTYFPLPKAERNTIIVKNGSKGISMTPGMDSKVVNHVKGEMLELEDAGELDYVMMDRMQEDSQIGDNLIVSMALAATAICIRPTTLPFWAYMGFELVLRTAVQGFLPVAAVISKAVLAGLTVLAGSTYIDYTVTGKVYFPIITFINQNVVQNVSEYYGATTPLYHLTQSLPILLFPLWIPFIKGFLASLLPTSCLPQSLQTTDRPAGLRLLSRALVFSIAVLSLSPHSEWRFLHPFLPPLLLFALPPLFKQYKPVITGAYYLKTALRQYLRLPSSTVRLLLLAPVVPYLYLNIFHGRAQVEVMSLLRRGDLGRVESLIVLAPCHSFPWMSSLHNDVPGWFLTCEPPLGVNASTHQTQQSIFYSDPVKYLNKIFPYPPVHLHEIGNSTASDEMPSHLVMFGEVLDRSGVDGSVRDSLGILGYEEKFNLWNGFDILQDEEERRGGVRVWVKPAVKVV